MQRSYGRVGELDFKSFVPGGEIVLGWLTFCAKGTRFLRSGTGGARADAGADGMTDRHARKGPPRQRDCFGVDVLPQCNGSRTLADNEVL
jgi:hypothetical protein